MLKNETLSRFRYQVFPDHVIGEILAKRWIDNTIPAVALVILAAVLSQVTPTIFSGSSVIDFARQLSELGLVSMAMMIVIMAGGIDLSIGSVFALSALVSLYCISVLQWPFGFALLATVGAGVFCGLVNGLLIGYLRLRAFLTTLVTLVIYRSVYDLVFPLVSTSLVANSPDSAAWDFLAYRNALGLPISFLVLIVVAIVAHVALSRTRPGWQLTAVGGARRSAHNAGINVRLVVCLAYVTASALCSVAGVLFASRLGGTGPNAGVGLEVTALTAVVAGGSSLGGGRGSVAKAMFGAVFVLLLMNGMIRMGYSGGMNTLVLGFVLIVAVMVDMRWVKNRAKLLNSVYTSPTYLAIPSAPATEMNSGSPYAVNSKLDDVDLICPGELDGPEDVILDDDDNIYFGSRQGDIVRISAPDYRSQEVFAHVGGRPLGMAFDRERNLVVAVASMGVYKVSPSREVTCLTAETNRSFFSIVDDSKLGHADDLDIAPDGRIFFSDSTTRYSTHNWAGDALEGRGNGRIVCYDPRDKSTRTLLRNLVFTNGVCVAHDGQSIYFAETWACRIRRYWIAGPNKGRLDVVIDNLPGLPDNINRASDGTYWLAIIGMRTDTFDLAMRMPGFRKRMVRRVAPDGWLFPNLNTGCVVKFNADGEVLDALWDAKAVNHPMITSMREHKGELYLGGLMNDRIGRYRLPAADPNWTGNESYWGPR